MTYVITARSVSFRVHKFKVTTDLQERDRPSLADLFQCHIIFTLTPVFFVPSHPCNVSDIHIPVQEAHKTRPHISWTIATPSSRYFSGIFKWTTENNRWTFNWDIWQIPCPATVYTDNPPSDLLYITALGRYPEMSGAYFGVLCQNLSGLGEITKNIGHDNLSSIRNSKQYETRVHQSTYSHITVHNWVYWSYNVATCFGSWSNPQAIH
jgi:hypothetical protein